MDGAEIRRLRRRAGLTQEALAELVGVEQGTVSRWERDIERPRPRSANALRRFLLRDLERSVALRQTALIRNNLVTGGILDTGSRLSEVNDRAVRFYIHNSNYDIRNDLGTLLKQQLLNRDNEVGWKALEDSGLLQGAALLVRSFVSTEDFSHLTHYEPLFENGDFAGVVAYVARTVPAGVKTTGPRVRFVDALHLDDPTEMVVLHRSAGWGQAKALLENDTLR